MFNYKWNIKDGYPAKGIEKNNLKVYSTFACGGGSTMGYKLAGFDVIGANDIDPQMAKVYKENHNPKFYDLCPIGELLDKDLPKEYYNLDILDGSPPCSTFSTAGSREKGWKKEKKFREGQAKQVLSDLFFDWIKLVDKLSPKVAIAENVKGMLIGNAKAYTKKILQKLDDIGYDVQLFCLNSASMGVPQKRERVFFVCKRKDLKMPKLKLNFNEKPILFRTISDEFDKAENLSELYKKYWVNTKPGQPIGKFKSSKKLDYKKTSNTIPSGGMTVHPKIARTINKKETCLIGSYPLDYKFLDVKFRYLIGMSVPPIMTAQVANQVYLQLFKN